MPSVPLSNGTDAARELQPATGPGVWQATDFAGTGWMQKLDQDDIGELEAAVAAVSHIER